MLPYNILDEEKHWNISHRVLQVRVTVAVNKKIHLMGKTFFLRYISASPARSDLTLEIVLIKVTICCSYFEELADFNSK